MRYKVQRYFFNRSRYTPVSRTDVADPFCTFDMLPNVAYISHPTNHTREIIKFYISRDEGEPLERSNLTVVARFFGTDRNCNYISTISHVSPRVANVYVTEEITLGKIAIINIALTRLIFQMS